MSHWLHLRGKSTSKGLTCSQSYFLDPPSFSPGGEEPLPLHPHEHRYVHRGLEGHRGEQHLPVRGERPRRAQRLLPEDVVQHVHQARRPRPLGEPLLWHPEGAQWETGGAGSCRNHYLQVCCQCCTILVFNLPLFQVVTLRKWWQQQLLVGGRQLK